MVAFVVVLTLSLGSLGVCQGGEFDRRTDVTGDGVVDERDIFMVQQQWQLVRPTPTPFAGQEITIDLPGLPADAFRLEMVRIPAGSFIMGSTEPVDWCWCHPDNGLFETHCEGPVHEVVFSEDFYMSRHEITQDQWLAVMGSEPAWGAGDGHNHPVYRVSWDDCMAFIDALNDLGVGTFRLPSEAEWEYACRAGTTTRFHFGDSNCYPYECLSCGLSEYGWWCGYRIFPGTRDVGEKIPNAFSLYDMHGNVREWVQDRWHDSYTGAPPDGSAWESGDDTRRVLRGGSWNLPAATCRSASRSRAEPGFAGDDTGLRIVAER
jgi:formylglycine-generating enzyme required for sulfatase activity